MKVVKWDDDTVPYVETDDNGDILVEDSRMLFNLQDQDLVIYQTEVGSTLYQVVNVVREEWDDDTNLVTIKALL